MIHQAIYNLYDNVSRIDGDDNVIAYDKNDNIVTFDINLVNAEAKRLQNEYNAKQYQRNRAKEYPSIADQLDYIYHNGIDAWKTNMIDPVKTKYPKGTV